MWRDSFRLQIFCLLLAVLAIVVLVHNFFQLEVSGRCFFSKRAWATSFPFECKVTTVAALSYNLESQKIHTESDVWRYLIQHPPRSVDFKVSLGCTGCCWVEFWRSLSMVRFHNLSGQPVAGLLLSHREECFSCMRVEVASFLLVCTCGSSSSITSLQVVKDYS